MLRAHVVSQFTISDADAKNIIDGDWIRGIIFHKSMTGGRVTRIFDKKNVYNELQVAASAKDSGLTFDFEGQLDAINKVA